MASRVRSVSVDNPDGKNVILQQLLRRMNFTDRTYAAWYLLLTIALLIRPQNIEHWSHFLLFNSAILAAIIVLSCYAKRTRTWEPVYDWYPIFLFTLAFEEIARLSLAFVPSWQDSWLLRFEQSLFGLPPTVWLGQFQNPLLTEVLEFGYFSFYWLLPVVGIVLYAKKRNLLNEAGERPFRLWMDALAIGYIVCFTIYLVFPTEGPAHTLVLSQGATVAAGPFRWLVLFVQLHGGVHGNAFPSGHIMAAVISLLAALRWSPRLGKWLILPVLLMGIGAVYDSYHYVSDIVAGAFVGIAAFALTLHLLRFRRNLA
jgi:membrane-associated phospholipid phosphatase